jgi:hypothetical protein
MAKRNQSNRPAPASIPAWDKQVKPERVTVDSVVVSDKHPKGDNRLLSTPPPWKQDWLDLHGLQVIYRNGGATLAYKK